MTMLFALLLAADVAAPSLADELEMKRPIVDYADVIVESTEDDLSRRMHDHREASGVAVGVMTVPALAGHTLGEVTDDASRLFRAGWAQGAPHVLVVLSIADKKMRIEVDDRLTGMLTAADVQKLNDDATRTFAAGRVQEGVVALVDGIIAKTPRAPMEPQMKAKVTLAVAGVAIAVTLAAALVMRLRRKRATAAA